MILDNVVSFVSYVAVVSIAAERTTDMIKRAALLDERLSKFKGVSYQLLSAISGGLICLVSPPESSPFYTNKEIMALIVGLLASGGSSLWHDILGLIQAYRTSVTTSLPEKS